MKRLLWVVVAGLLWVPVVQAKEAQLMGEDPVLEARMMALAEELRCLVCQNQTLASSHADLAKDFRHEIIVLMKKGKSDDEVVEFLVDRYGDFVRYRPPLKPTTILLWAGPALLMVGGAITLVVTLRRRRTLSTPEPLSADEQARLNSLLDKDDKSV